MPIYEYRCPQCDTRFEELIRSAEQTVACPQCGARKLERQPSVFATHNAPVKSAAPPGCGQCAERGGCPMASS